MPHFFYSKIKGINEKSILLCEIILLNTETEIDSCKSVTTPDVLHSHLLLLRETVKERRFTGKRMSQKGVCYRKLR